MVLSGDRTTLRRRSRVIDGDCGIRAVAPGITLRTFLSRSPRPGGIMFVLWFAVPVPIACPNRYTRLRNRLSLETKTIPTGDVVGRVLAMTRNNRCDFTGLGTEIFVGASTTMLLKRPVAWVS